MGDRYTYACSTCHVLFEDLGRELDRDEEIEEFVCPVCKNKTVERWYQIY